MVLGEAGIGKSTLLNSMFLTDIYSGEYPGPSERIKKTVQVETTKILLKVSPFCSRINILFTSKTRQANAW